MTKDVIVVVDRASWGHHDWKQIQVPCLPGIWHDHYCGNYRNYAFALAELYKSYPVADWYCWLEYDVLIATPWFKNDLVPSIWMAGCDLRNYPCEFPELSRILGLSPMIESKYLLGCVHFLSGYFVRKLVKMNFFSRILEATKDFPPGHFPGYGRYAFEEEMCPIMAHQLGGRIFELSCWLEDVPPEMPAAKKWRRTTMYPVRFRPEMIAAEVASSAAIIHPVKSADHPIRQHYRRLRG